MNRASLAVRLSYAMRDVELHPSPESISTLRSMVDITVGVLADSPNVDISQRGEE